METTPLIKWQAQQHLRAPGSMRTSRGELLIHGLHGTSLDYRRQLMIVGRRVGDTEGSMTVAEDSIVVSIIDQRDLAERPAPTDGRERRASERAISYWQKKISELGGKATVAALDLAALDSEEWSSRFVMTIDPLLDGSSLLLYGIDVARMLDLPPGSKARVPIMRRLPSRYVPVFRRGCAAVMEHNAAVRVEGEVDREDGKKELFRAIIIPVGEASNNTVRLAFGAFSCRSS